MNIELLIAVATALGVGGLLQTIWSSFSQRRKVGADAAKELSAAAVELLSPYREELRLERAEAKADRAEEARVIAKARADMGVVVAKLEVCQRKVSQLNAKLDASLERNRELELLLGRQS